ncbi:MAG: DUF6335 family protein [Vicinamibacterales bacterium]
MAKSSKGRKKAAAKTLAPARRRAAGAASSKKKAAKKAPARAAGRKAPVKKAAKKTAKKATRPAARKAAPKKVVARKVAPKKAAPKKTVAPRKAAAAKKPAPKAAATKPAKAPAVMAKAAPVRKAAAPAPKAARPAPGLNRERRTVGEAPTPSAPSTLGAHRHASAAASGGEEMRVKLASHTGDGPAITAGDVDANWVAAETVGDEAPGGDNPTPDQDVVDEIGRALGVEYDDDEELQGGDEIAARDHDRWELDPASSDDFDER